MKKITKKLKVKTRPSENGSPEREWSREHLEISSKRGVSHPGEIPF